MKENRLLLMLITMLFVFGTAFLGSSNLYAGSKTPYKVLMKALEEKHFNTPEATLEMIVPDSVMQIIMPELKSTFRIMQDVSFPPNANISEVLTTLMQAKYAEKSDAKEDFYKIQYSLHSDDFAKYLGKYPKSKFVSEAESKLKCTQQHEAFLKAKKNGSTYAYRTYASSYGTDMNSVCKYEGYDVISQSDNAQLQAIEAWLSLLNSEKTTDGVRDCSVYSDYLDTYGSFSVLANEAKNKLNLCFDQNAWQQAMEQGTIEAYQCYVDKYPEGSRSSYAKNKIKDWTTWKTAREKNSYQGYLEYYKNFPSGDSVALAQKEFIPNEASAVDLGLPSGTRWAPCNVGAVSPEEYGDYYAWGEIKEKRNYTWKSYQYFEDKNGNGKPWTDGKTDLGEITIEKNNISGTRYDVAHVKWGGGWKLPTKEQCQELVDKCKWTWWTTQNLQEGYKVTGPNGNSIFLPAAGYRYDAEEVARAGFRGGYWSSTRDEIMSHNSYLLRFKEYDAFELNPVLRDVFANSLRYGRTVRPVTNVKSIQQTLEPAKQMPSFPIEKNITENTPVINITGHNAVDLGLPSGTKWADCNIGASSPTDYGDYFAWGETQMKRSYAWKTYKYIIDKNKNGIDDYGEDGYKDIGTDISGTNYDVAHVKWGASWKMPNEEQWKELKDCCTWTATAWKGRKGYKVTGPNGRVIFLPAAGYIWETEGKEIGKSGEYWFATSLNRSNMLSFDVDRNEIHISGRAQFAGVTVRPVTE